MKTRPKLAVTVIVATDGSYRVSHWEGRVYRVTVDGTSEKLLDTSVSGGNVADFGYVPDGDLLLAPTFFGDQVVGYNLGG